MAAKPQAQAARNEDVGNEFLVFTLGEAEYGIDILKVQEIRGYDADTVTRIANVPPFIKGVTNLRDVYKRQCQDFLCQGVSKVSSCAISTKICHISHRKGHDLW